MMKNMNSAQLIKLINAIDIEIQKCDNQIRTAYWIRLKNTKRQALLILSKRRK